MLSESWTNEIIYPCLTLLMTGGLNRLNSDLVDVDNLQSHDNANEKKKKHAVQ